MAVYLQRHHLNWSRTEWLERKLSKHVRNAPAYSIDLECAVHRLLHSVLEPPEVPDTETLIQMRDMGNCSIEEVMRNLDHPIVEHYEHQLIIASIAPARARQKLADRDFEVYGITRTRLSDTFGQIGRIALPSH